MKVDKAEHREASQEAVAELQTEGGGDSPGRSAGMGLWLSLEE